MRSIIPIVFIVLAALPSLAQDLNERDAAIMAELKAIRAELAVLKAELESIQNNTPSTATSTTETVPKTISGPSKPSKKTVPPPPPPRTEVEAAAEQLFRSGWVPMGNAKIPELKNVSPQARRELERLINEQRQPQQPVVSEPPKPSTAMSAASMSNENIKEALRKDKAEFEKKNEKAQLSNMGGTQTVMMDISPKTRLALQKLEAIEFPRFANENELREYASSVLAVADELPFDSKFHLPYLTKMGADGFIPLMDIYRECGREDLRMRMMPAMIELASEDRKPMILEELPYYPSLVHVVEAKRWELDARQILVSRLAEHPAALPLAWIKSVARLQDPATYEDLKYYLVNHFNRPEVYEAIQGLPGINLEDTLEQAWHAASHDPITTLTFMDVALSHGNRQALTRLATLLAEAGNVRTGRAELEKAVGQYTEYAGPPEQLREWLKMNKDLIIWDSERGKFIVSQVAK